MDEIFDAMTSNHLEEAREESHPNWETPRATPQINKGTELLVIKIPIPFELDYEANYNGLCGCDYCKEHPEEAVELYKGKTVFLLDSKAIYCDCLEKYLKDRMMTS